MLFRGGREAQHQQVYTVSLLSKCFDDRFLLARGAEGRVHSAPFSNAVILSKWSFS